MYTQLLLRRKQQTLCILFNLAFSSLISLNARAVVESHIESYVFFEPVLDELINRIQETKSTSQTSTTPVINLTQSSGIATAVGLTPSATSGTSQEALRSGDERDIARVEVAAIAQKVKETPTIKAQYKAKYASKQREWGSAFNGTSLKSRYNVFFDMSDFLEEKDINEDAVSLSSGVLTERGVEALQWRFAMDRSLNFLNHTDELAPITDLVTINPDNSVSLNQSVLKSKLLEPSLRYTVQPEKSVYARIVKVGTGSRAKYLVVAVEQHGGVFVIDPSNQTKPYAKNFVSEILKGFNAQKRSTNHRVYSSSSNNFIYGGLQGGDIASTAGGIFAFAYWSAIMSANSIEAYKSLNGFQSEREPKLKRYSNLAVGAVYSKKVDKMPSSVSSNEFEFDIRKWLREEALKL